MAANIVAKEKVKVIIADGDPRQLIKAAEELGNALAADGLSTTQIRNVFGEVRNIETGWSTAGANENLRRLLLLQPRMAYQKKRDPKTAPLMDTLKLAIDQVVESDDDKVQRARFTYFVDFFEAILAYHTAADKKSNFSKGG